MEGGAEPRSLWWGGFRRRGLSSNPWGRGSRIQGAQGDRDGIQQFPRGWVEVGMVWDLEGDGWGGTLTPLVAPRLCRATPPPPQEHLGQCRPGAVLVTSGELTLEVGSWPLSLWLFLCSTSCWGRGKGTVASQDKQLPLSLHLAGGGASPPGTHT